MKKRIYKILTQSYLRLKRHKTLVHNFGYLSIIQVFTVLIPLITLPYLIRVLGTETYGMIVFAQAVITYFVILVNFGFNISATKEVSIHREDKEKLSEIVSSVLIIKGALFFLSLLLLSVILYLLPQAKEHKMLFYLTMYMCLYEWLFPVWYFQGIEKMKYITVVNFISRGVFLGLIFFVIKEQSDYLKVPLINGVGSVIAGGVALWVIFCKRKIKFRIFKFTILRNYLLNSYFIFFARASNTVTESTTKILMGIFLTTSDITIFDLLIKTTSIARKPFEIFSTILMPNFVRSPNKKKAYNVLKYSLFLSGIIYIVLIFLRKDISMFFLSSINTKLTNSLWIVGLLVPLGALSWGLGENILVPFNRMYSYNVSTISRSAFFFLFLGFIFTELSFHNMIVLIVTSAFFEVLVRFYFVKKI